MQEVYFIDTRTSSKENMFVKFRRLMDKLALSSLIERKSFVCIKIHFGEIGNLGYIPAVLVKELVKIVKELGGKPYLCDTNTLYGGGRSNAVDHITTAISNGFSHDVVGCPIIIGDGLKGKDYVVIKIGKKHFMEVYLGRAIVEADVLICFSHFKCHGLTGFGATLKNLGMGAAAKIAKYKMHADIIPHIDANLCEACGYCVSKCPQNAIYINSQDKKYAAIDKERCIGCGECLSLCDISAVKINWFAVDPGVIQERIVEYAYGLLKCTKKVVFINYVMQISPECDCCNFTDAYIVPDVGILGSYDAVALDQASVNLVNRQPGIKNSALKGRYNPGEDKIRGVHQNIDWEVQLRYAQELQIGSREYKLVKL